MKTLYFTFVFLMLFFTTGCMKNDAVVIADKSGVETESNANETWSNPKEDAVKSSKSEAGGSEGIEGDKSKKSAVGNFESSDSDKNIGAGNFESNDSDKNIASVIYVYVCGHVNCPGVYKLSTGSRIYDALDLAGGITEDGRPEALDQAKPVSDGQTIYVPGLDEEWTGVNSLEREESAFSPNDEGTVNINSASKEVLMTLPGIGESKADDIIKYREETGGFKSIEDIMKIQGIKEGVYNKIKDRISI